MLFRSSLEMIVEHRNAPRPDPVELILRVDGAPHLEVVSSAEAIEESVDHVKNRIVEVLSKAQAPMTQEGLRAQLRVRLQKVVGALRDLERENRIQRLSAGWSVTSNGDSTPRTSPTES